MFEGAIDEKFVPPTLVALMLAALDRVLIAIDNGPCPAWPGESAIYTRMQRNQQSLKSLRANIGMQKYNSQLQMTATITRG
jgi:hypothetical protein